MPGLTVDTQPSHISGVLNNCPVVVALDEVIKSIAYFANQEGSAAAQRANPALDARKETYQGILRTFEITYGLPPQALTFRLLNDFLTTKLGSNLLAQQFIMGPVMRSFASLHGAPDELWTLQADGRFATLTMEQACQYVWQPLGISITANEKLNASDARYQVSQYAVSVDPVASVDVFNEGVGHWDRGPAGASLSNGRTTISDECPAVERFIDTITGFDRKDAVIDTMRQTVIPWVQAGLREVSLLVASHAAAAQRHSSSVRSSSGLSNLQMTLLQQSRAGFFNSIRSADRIKAEDIDAAQAKPGETDAEFAKRLQAAEINCYNSTMRRR